MTGRGIEEIWAAEDAAASVARGLLAIAGAPYAAVTAIRNALYDRGVLRTHVPAIPALSLGNLSVGGTGKTPVAAWAARELRARGAHPAIVLRGYGDDEPLVHARLNPEVPVIADADRVRGAATAASRGADCVVLDDAFQHRRIARVADWVLVSAETWRDDARLLPAGPLRERPRALRRATLVVVTRKTARLDRAEEVGRALSAWAPGVPVAFMHLAPRCIVAADGTELPVSALMGRRYVAAAAVGEPGAFFGQLRALGADITERAFRDHHRFTADDVARLSVAARGTEGVICTLKDAVKLAPLWRGADAPLWYVSQAAAVDRGGPDLDASLESVLAARLSTL